MSWRVCAIDAFDKCISLLLSVEGIGSFVALPVIEEIGRRITSRDDCEIPEAGEPKNGTHAQNANRRGVPYPIPGLPCLSFINPSQVHGHADLFTQEKGEKRIESQKVRSPGTVMIVVLVKGAGN